MQRISTTEGQELPAQKRLPDDVNGGLMSLWRPGVLTLIITLTATLTACASTPVPQDKLALAQSSIERAERANAVELAGVPLRDARQKLEQARSAAEKKDGTRAGMLAEEADVDAQRAEAQALAMKSERSVADMQKSLQTLQQEAQRNSGSTEVAR